MKKKGFTLIELIVVIAIIGVLAAILVPAMLGYIKKSKITNANAAAKSIMTAATSAVTDIDAEDKVGMNVTAIADVNSTAIATDFPTTTSTTDVDVRFASKVRTYFSDIIKLDSVSIDMNNGICDAVAVMDGRYPGTNPFQMSVDDYDSQPVGASAASYIGYAIDGVF